MKEPLGQKEPKAPKDSDYMGHVASLPCCICEAWGMQQLSRTTVHHWIMGRYGNRRTPDKETIPLCDGHHQGDFDTSKVALHREPERWRELYGRDKDWTEPTQERIGEMI